MRPLTTREENAIRGIIAGLSHKQQARDDGCSLSAIRCRLHRAYRKLDARNKTEAALLWRDHNRGEALALSLRARSTVRYP